MISRPPESSLSPDAPTLSQALLHARGLSVAALDAQLLLLKAIRRPLAERSLLYRQSDERLNQQDWEIYRILLGRKALGVPTAALTGHKEFFGRDFLVSGDTLIPRPETELLVEWCQELATQRTPHTLRIADLGTGCGVIATTLALSFSEAKLVATDANAAALRVAKQNARRFGAEIDWRKGDWFGALKVGESFDFIVSNPPYLDASEFALADLSFEPDSALVARRNGLEDLLTIVSSGAKWLKAGGVLLVEHGAEQGAATREHFARAGFRQIQTRRDLAGKERATCGLNSETQLTK